MPETRGSLLVIDDEPQLRETLEELLAGEGYLVDSAANGEEGLSRLARRVYDLVLLDAVLPDQSGLDVLQKIRASNPALEIGRAHV